MSINKKELQKRDKDQYETVERTNSQQVFMPAVDILETDTELQLYADMPGVDESSVDITLDKDILTITGHADTTAPEGYEAVYREFTRGDYQRSFTISEAVDAEKISASVKNGVLQLTLPKSAPAIVKKIKVNAG